MEFIFDLGFGKHLSDENVKEAVENAIMRRSVILLLWLRQKILNFDIASAKQTAIYHYHNRLDDPDEGRLIHWLETQVSDYLMNDACIM